MPLKLTTLTGVLLLTAFASVEGSDQPNIVLIMGEAVGWASTSVQMDDAVPESKSTLARTPALERLAATGMRFANFYAASPRCTPTRAALMTGKNPAVLHMTFVGEGKGGRESSFNETGSRLIPAPFISELPEGETTLPELLRLNGYTTAHFGKWHLGRTSPDRYGFDEHDGPNNNGGPENVENPNPKQAFNITELGIAFVERQAKTGKPFYLQLSHYPGRGGTDARPESYLDVRRRAATDRDQRLIGAAAVIEDMDFAIGKLLERLTALGILEHTYVIFTADHGAQGRSANGPLANGKGTVWEGGLRVPLIISGPGVKADVCNHLRTSTVDLLPTICDLAHAMVTSREHLEGGSLVPTLHGDATAKIERESDDLIMHFPHYDKDEQGPAAAIYSGNLKAIHSFESGQLSLFDLSKDLSERHDLAHDQPAATSELGRRLLEYLDSVGASMPTLNPRFDPTKDPPHNQRR